MLLPIPKAAKHMHIFASKKPMYQTNKKKPQHTTHRRPSHLTILEHRRQLHINTFASKGSLELNRVYSLPTYRQHALLTVKLQSSLNCKNKKWSTNICCASRPSAQDFIQGRICPEDFNFISAS